MSNDDSADDRRRRFLEALGIGTDDFAGTGMSFEEFTARGMLDRWRNSISNLSDRTEKRRRIRLVRQLCATMDDIQRRHGIFNMRLLEEGLVAVINGGWPEVRVIADFLLYAEEDERHRAALVAVHGPIRQLLLEACDTAPASATDPIH